MAMNEALENVIDFENYPLAEEAFRAKCKDALDRDGALVIPGFLKAEVVDSIRLEWEDYLNFWKMTATGYYVRETSTKWTREINLS